MNEKTAVASLEFKIERDVVLPPARRSRALYPFLEMEPGDSFALPASLQKRVRSAACRFGGVTAESSSFASTATPIAAGVWRKAAH